MRPNASLATTSDASHRRAFMDRHALGPEPPHDDRRQFWIILAERGDGFDHGDGGTEPPMCLRHLEADRATADDDQMFRPLCLFEQGLVGQVADTVEPRYRRYRGRGARRDDEASGADLDIAGNDGASVLEAGLLLDHVHAKRLEAANGIVRRDRSND